MSAMRMTAYVLMAALALATPVTSAGSGSLARAASSMSSSSSSMSSSSSSTGGDVTFPSTLLANATSHVVSVWSDDDDCSATTQRAGCTFDAICDVCLSRKGCAIESTTGKCVSISRINSANTGVEYFWSSKGKYCDASDAVCTVCASGASDAPCYGASGCFCLRQCELQSQAPLECSSAMSFTKMTYFALVIVVFGSLALCVHVRRIKLNNVIADRLGLRRLVQRRPRASRPLALELDTWKKDCVDHSEEFTNLELRSCFVQMYDEDDDSQRATMLHDSRSSNGDSLCLELEDFECFREREESHSLPAATESEATITARAHGEQAA